jgi:nucleoside-diphosphate-sugar epimerase
VNPVFITGGTGYVGRPLIDALLKRGFEVHASRGANRRTSFRLARVR